jgi:hypothetical protein
VDAARAGGSCAPLVVRFEFLTEVRVGLQGGCART